MSTWHQQRAGRPQLQDATRWTVVIDPPNDCTAIMRCDSQRGANEYLANIKARGERHAYIVAPTFRVKEQQS